MNQRFVLQTRIRRDAMLEVLKNLNGTQIFKNKDLVEEGNIIDSDIHLMQFVENCAAKLNFQIEWIATGEKLNL